MNKMRKKSRFIIAFAIAYVFGNVAEAVPIPGFWGNAPACGSENCGDLNFAVYDDPQNHWGLPGSLQLALRPAIASPLLDTSAKYLYLYQAVYDGSELASTITIDLNFGAGSLPTTSWGQFFWPDMTDVSFFNPRDAANHWRLDSGVPEFVNLGISNVMSVGGPFDVALSLDQVRNQLIIDTSLFPNSGSVMFGFTSNLAPQFRTFSFENECDDINNSGCDKKVFGTVASTSVPEPSSIILLTFGLAWLGRTKSKR